MRPCIHASSFVAKSAVVIGDVSVGKNCGIWPNSVIRGDLQPINIGDGTNIQDCCVIHAGRDHHVTIGDNVSIGHGAVVHGAIIEDNCLIGMNATVLDGVHIKHGSLIGANALVSADTYIKEYSLVLGVPAKIIKQDENLLDIINTNGATYRKLAKEHKEGKHHSF
jgi:carbonic anhydrase/acetyltransferase-like protein (isoleucine patch superfamily)